MKNCQWLACRFAALSDVHMLEDNPELSSIIPVEKQRLCNAVRVEDDAVSQKVA